MGFQYEVSIRDQIVPAPSGESLFHAMELIGVRSFEAAVNSAGELVCLGPADGGPYSIFDGDSLLSLRNTLDRAGVRIGALLLATDFSAPDAERHVDWTVRATVAAHELRVPVVRIDPLTADRSLPAARVCETFVRRTRRALEQTADTGVDLGMENHAHLFNDPDILDRILSALPESRFGLTLDTGNFYWWGHPLSRVYELIERYAPRTKHTHIKNIAYPEPVRESRREIGHEYKQCCAAADEGDLDLPKIVRLLYGGGYRRGLCIEDESLFKHPEADRLEILRREVQALRGAAAV
ncbi:MAG TPA: sugar phosphate isomerase/epimerase family protein [Tepidisphaeraceae bacterium]|nr:sugar phosphate isomerase/epimerase family protein [Tepidisphaeraceae bacterium]